MPAWKMSLNVTVAATALRGSRVAATPSTRPHESLRVTASSPQVTAGCPCPCRPTTC